MNALLQRLQSLLANTQSSAVRILCCGALGGLLATVRAASDGTGTETGFLEVARDVLMGAGAAFVAIYVLLGTNTQEVLRSCGVALLAGHFWSPIFDAGKEYVLAAPERAAEPAVAAATETLEKAVGKLEGSSGTAEDIKSAGNLAESLTDRIADLRSGAVKSRAQSAIARSLDAISAKAAANEAGVLDAIERVGDAAIRTANPRVLERTGLALGKLPTKTGTPSDVRTKELRMRFPPLR